MRVADGPFRLCARLPREEDETQAPSQCFDLRLSGRGLPSLPARSAASSRPSPTDLSTALAPLRNHLRLQITRVRAMGDDKAKANGNADWKPTPKQLAQRDEFAGRFAKLCAEKEAEGETKHRHLLIDPDDFDTVI